MASVKDLVSSAVQDSPDRKSTEALVRECHKIATAYIRQKNRRGGLRLDQLGLSVEDLAMDCLAELFLRDEWGRFRVFRTYFATIGWRDQSEEQVEIALRRLVFGRLNDGLFRRYGEADPDLAKIIRNIKLAAKGIPEISVVRRQSGVWLRWTGPSGSKSGVLAPPEVLEAFLITRLRGMKGLQVAVQAFSEFASSSPWYDSGYPLAGFAQVVRSALIRIEAATPDSGDTPAFREEEVERAILSASQQVQTRMYKAYVERKKTDEKTYDSVFRTIPRILKAQYLGKDREPESYYDALTVHMPGLTREAYLREHRHTLEYLTKMVRHRLISYLRA